MALLVAAVTLVPFLAVLRNEFVVWDDDQNFVENLAYRGLGWAQLRWMFTTFHLGHYQPLSWVTLGVDYLVWGLNPTGYHLTNLLLHALNAALLYRLLVLLLGRAGSTELAARHMGALFGALFFAVHPLRVESVAWASARRDVLSSLFYLLTVHGYLRMSEGRGGPRLRWLATSLGCYLLSLLSKGWGMTLPVVLLVLDVYPLGRLARTSWRPVLLEKVPYGALALGAALLAARGASVEAMRGFGEHGLWARLVQGAYGLCFYLVKTVLPVGLSPLYLLELPLDPWRPRYLLAVAAVLALTAGLWLARRRAPWALAAWVAYTAMVAPVLGLAQSGPQIAADRYTYLASLPWVALLAGGAARVWASRGAGVSSRARPVTVAAAAMLVLFAALAARQTLVWHDSRTLWDHVLALDATNYVAYTNRGMVRQTAGDLAGARADYDAALSWNPGHAIAQNNRGILRAGEGDLDGAIVDYTQAIRMRPRYADAYLNRAIANETKGNPRAAFADYGEAVRLDPGLARAWYGRANLRQAAGDLDGAIADYGEALRRNPAYVEAYANRAVARAAKGDQAGAAADYRRALTVAPRDFPGRASIERNLGGLGRP